MRRSLVDASLRSVATDPTFLVGAVAYAASFLTFVISLRRFEVLTVYPVFVGTAYGAIALAGAVILDEQITLVRLTGIVLVGVGVLLLVR